MELRQLLTYIIYLGIFSGIASNECCHLYTSKKSYVQIKGIVVSPLGIKQEEFFANCKVLVDDGQRSEFVRYTYSIILLLFTNYYTNNK